MLQFWSLAFYSAWILLSVTSSEAVSMLDVRSAGSLQGELYLSSGIALSAALILAGVFHDRVQPLVERGPFVPIMGALASIGTFVLMGGLGTSLAFATFIACGAVTGIGTAFVCLRVGFVTSKLDGTRAFIMVGSSALLANLLFFSCKTVPPAAALWAISLLPFISALSSFANASKDEQAPGGSDLIDMKSLPRGYFLRFIVTVFVFALAAGVGKGFAGLLSHGGEAAFSSSSWEVFISFVVMAAILLIAAVILAFRNLDIGKVYIPLGLMTAVCMLVCPMLGDSVKAQGVLVGVMYNVFILIVWCLLIEVAGRTNLSSTRVFGYGRGASALATTLGWAIATIATANLESVSNFYASFSIVMGATMVVAMALIFRERTISEALASTVADKEIAIEGVDKAELKRKEELGIDPWSRACECVAREAKLTARESEVFALLARGRSTSYIADELVIAQSTVKGYTKNVYAKIGVHSRQELIDLTESHMKAL